MPNNVKTYDESDDPEDHLKIFQGTVKVERKLSSTKKCIKDPVEIHHIKQREEESTKDFMQRFKAESRQIKELIKGGKLSHVIKELKQGSGKDQPKAATKRETSKKDKPLAILMVQPWQRVARQKITQSFSPNLKFLFPSLGDEDGAEGPMIIETEIGGHFIHRIYVDGVLTSEIRYEHCFNRLHPEVKNQMVPATAPHIGFSEEIIWPMGQILMPIKIGDAEHFTYTRMNIMVVRSPSPCNGIIGRPGVRKIQVVPSTTHGMLKFLATGGILTLRSSRIIPLECTMVSGPEAQHFDVNWAAKKRIKVAIHPEYP
nr:reverse transcriptase domain-containing protein [Tanacetum cinerariifolium]